MVLTSPVVHRPIKVLLVGGHSLFRQAVRLSLEEADDIVVVGECDLDSLSADRLPADPEVVVLDAYGTTEDAARLTQRLRKLLPDSRVVVLGERDPAVLVGVMETGASGYVTQQSALSDLIDVTRSVHRGAREIPRDMLEDLVDGLLRRRRVEVQTMQRLSRLTRREREVLELLADGADNRTIARVLSISPETARTHVQHVLAKLGLHSRLEAAAFFIQARVLVEDRTS